MLAKRVCSCFPGGAGWPGHARGEILSILKVKLYADGAFQAIPDETLKGEPRLQDARRDYWSIERREGWNSSYIDEKELLW